MVMPFAFHLHRRSDWTITASTWLEYTSANSDRVERKYWHSTSVTVWSMSIWIPGGVFDFDYGHQFHFWFSWQSTACIESLFIFRLLFCFYSTQTLFLLVFFGCGCGIGACQSGGDGGFSLAFQDFWENVKAFIAHLSFFFFKWTLERAN